MNFNLWTYRSTNHASLAYDKLHHVVCRERESLNKSNVEPPPKDVKINMGMHFMRELSAKWITDFFDYINSNKDIEINDFKKAGIVDALKGDTPAGFTDTLKFKDPLHLTATLICKCEN